MEVYRICFPEEINRIIKRKNFKNVGHIYETTKVNTHSYHPKTKYLHFFEAKDSIFYRRTNKGKYICTYDIPKQLLNDHFGYGFYRNFLTFKTTNLIEEYAIPTPELKIEYLKKVEFIKKDIDISDYIDDNTLSKYLEVIYENINQKKYTKVRKK